MLHIRVLREPPPGTDTIAKFLKDQQMRSYGSDSGGADYRSPRPISPGTPILDAQQRLNFPEGWRPRLTFKKDGSVQHDVTRLAHKIMKTNCSVFTACLRRVCAAVVVFVGGAGLAPAADESGNGSSGAETASARSTGCMAGGRLDRIFVRVECHERTEPVLHRHALDPRTSAMPARRMQVEFAGLDLLTGQFAEHQTTALAATLPSRHDSSPGAREIGPLRWTWASATWKF